MLMETARDLQERLYIQFCMLGRLFKLSWLKERSKLFHALVREFCLTDDCTFIEHSESVLQDKKLAGFAIMVDKYGLTIPKWYFNQHQDICRTVQRYFTYGTNYKSQTTSYTQSASLKISGATITLKYLPSAKFTELQYC